MGSFLFGFLFGILVVSVAIIKLILFILDPNVKLLIHKDPEHLSVQDIPPLLKDYFVSSLSPSPEDYRISENLTVSPTHDIEWINVVVARYFCSLRNSSIYKQKTCQKLKYLLQSLLMMLVRK
jgi:hypothetical protein